MRTTLRPETTEVEVQDNVERLPKISGAIDFSLIRDDDLL